MSHLNPIEVARRYYVPDCPEALIPATRLRNILDRLEQDHRVSPIAMTYLQKQGFVALLRLARKEVTYETFCEFARIELANREIAIEVEKQAAQAREKAAEEIWAAKAMVMRHQAEAARIARESDPKYINKMRNQQLRACYGLDGFIEPDCFPRLMDILRRIDGGNRLTEDDAIWLNTKGRDYFSGRLYTVFHESEAEFFASEYQRTNDPWMAVNASGHYRKCDKSNQANELVRSIFVARQKSPKLKSALLTTHGGAMRDLGYCDEALSFGNQAHALTPTDFRPCTLLGALNMELGNYDIAKEWYKKAIERGASERSIDQDLRGIFMRADKAKREEIKDFLLREDSARYSWVRQ